MHFGHKLSIHHVFLMPRNYIVILKNITKNYFKRNNKIIRHENAATFFFIFRLQKSAQDHKII